MQLGVGLAFLAGVVSGRLTRLPQTHDQGKLVAIEKQSYSYQSAGGSQVEAEVEYGPHHVDYRLQQHKEARDAKGRSTSHMELTSSTYASDEDVGLFKERAEEFVHNLPPASDGSGTSPVAQNKPQRGGEKCWRGGEEKNKVNKGSKSLY